MSYYQLVPGVYVEELPEKEGKITVSIGPQHPGSGHFRLIITIDGDVVVDADPDPGYVHRGEEKMCETRDYIQNIPHLERPVVLDSAGIQFPYILAAEEILDIKDKVPEKAKYLRILLAEFNRVISHFYFLAIQAIFLGHSTVLEWSMADREVLMDLAAMLTGARVTFAYFVPGGVRSDVPSGFVDQTLKAVGYLRSRMKEYWRMLVDNPFMKMRMEGVGVLKAKDAIELGAVGPNLRASGVEYDIRKVDPYSLYDTVEFHVPTYKEGDTMSRIKIRLDEINESLGIIEQVVRKLDGMRGPVRHLVKGAALRAKPGEAYARTEAARGMMSFYIISDGGRTPYRVKVDTPSFRNMKLIPVLLKDVRVADVPIVFWSIDYWPVEADR